jgi:hypothetical protein
MAERVTILKIFVSSPDDVSEERRHLDDVIRDLNTAWGKRLGLRLELVKWETHTFPNAGPDAQSVVNAQIGDDYDLFLGILWKRFGTPTPRAGSGTQEEFEKAYKRFKANPDELRIMFYFKDAPVFPNELDTDQLKLVQDFRKELQERGVLYHSYTSVEEFGNLAQLHLSHHVEEWGRTWQTRKPQPVQALAEPSTVSAIPADTTLLSEEDGEGFLDLIELGADSLQALHEVSERITEATATFGQKLDKNREELDKLKSPAPSMESVKHYKRLVNAAADDMDKFAARLGTEVPIFGETYRKGVRAYAGAATLVRDFGQADKADVQAGLETSKVLVLAMATSRGSLSAFRNIVSGLPRLTTKLNGAKRRLLKVLDSLDVEFASAINQTDEVSRTFGRIVKDMEQDQNRNGEELVQ